MPEATSKTTTAFIPDLEAATERILEANERFVEMGKKVTDAYLSGIERYVSGVTRLERNLGEQTPIEAVSSLLNAHAQITDDVTKAGVSAARQLIAQ